MGVQIVYERQCAMCGLIFDVDQPVDVNSFVCHYCWPKSLNRAMRSLMRVKARLYVGN